MMHTLAIIAAWWIVCSIPAAMLIAIFLIVGVRADDYRDEAQS